jgi:hypothetical protein
MGTWKLLQERIITPFGNTASGLLNYCGHQDTILLFWSFLIGHILRKSVHQCIIIVPSDVRILNLVPRPSTHPPFCCFFIFFGPLNIYSPFFSPFFPPLIFPFFRGTKPENDSTQISKSNGPQRTEQATILRIWRAYLPVAGTGKIQRIQGFPVQWSPIWYPQRPSVAWPVVTVEALRRGGYGDSALCEDPWD